MNKKKGEVPNDRTRTSSQTSRKKAPRQEQWQEVAKFQQEISNLQIIEADQEMKLMHLETSLKKLQKNLVSQEVPRTDMEGRVSYYLGQVSRLQEEAEKIKAASERKLDFLKQLKKKADDYVVSIKHEQRRHQSAMDEMNMEMMNNLERLKKCQQEFQDLERVARMGRASVLDRLKPEFYADKPKEPDLVSSELVGLETAENSYEDCDVTNVPYECSKEIAEEVNSGVV